MASLAIVGSLVVSSWPIASDAAFFSSNLGVRIGECKYMVPISTINVLTGQLQTEISVVDAVFYWKPGVNGQKFAIVDDRLVNGMCTTDELSSVFVSIEGAPVGKSQGNSHSTNSKPSTLAECDAAWFKCDKKSDNPPIL